MNKWNERWFKRAKEISTWSKDPSTKIGCVYVDVENRQELSAGYNGFPRNIKDDDRLLDRETKYKYVVHAEMNGIYNAVHKGISLKGSRLYVYGLPVCSECAKGIIQVGVRDVYMCFPSTVRDNWKQSFELTQDILWEAGVYYEYYDLTL